MGVIGLTDKPVIRRDGKIRAGTGPKSGGFHNPDHFLMKDCPQLIPVLGDKPKDIFFTFHSDNPDEIANIDLRWYNAAELLCKSMHNTTDKSKPIGPWAAYRGVVDVKGATQEPYLGIPRSRKRQCDYKSCPQYMAEDCSEHLFLNLMVPQYSMGSIFTLDSVSIHAAVNLLGLIEKVSVQCGGKFSGEIYRMYKKEVESTFQGEDGKPKKKKLLAVHFDHVPYKDYLEKFSGKVPAESLQALERLRARQGLVSASAYAQASLLAHANAQGPVALLGLDDDTEVVSTEQTKEIATTTGGGGKSDEDFIRERANHALVAPVFEELSKLAKVENSELNRMKMAKIYPSVEQLKTYLDGKLKEAKKRQEIGSAGTTAASTASTAQATGPGPTAPMESPLF